MNYVDADKTAEQSSDLLSNANFIWECLSLSEAVYLMRKNASYYSLLSGLYKPTDNVSEMVSGYDNAEIWKKHLDLFLYQLIKAPEHNMEKMNESKIFSEDEVSEAIDMFADSLEEFYAINQDNFSFFSDRLMLILHIIIRTKAYNGNVAHLCGRIIGLNSSALISELTAKLTSLAKLHREHEALFSTVNGTIDGEEAFNAVTGALLRAIDDFAESFGERRDLQGFDALVMKSDIIEWYRCLGMKAADQFSNGMRRNIEKQSLFSYGCPLYYFNRTTTWYLHTQNIDYESEGDPDNPAEPFLGSLPKWKKLIDVWVKDPSRDGVYEMVINGINHGLRLEMAHSIEHLPYIDAGRGRFLLDVHSEIIRHPMTSLGEKLMLERASIRFRDNPAMPGNSPQRNERGKSAMTLFAEDNLPF